MPTTYDMTGITHDEITTCLVWLRGHIRGTADGVKISVVFGRDRQVEAWGDILVIENAETRSLRCKRWWEKDPAGDRQMLLPFCHYQPLTVTSVYRRGASFELDLAPQRHRHNLILYFNSDSRTPPTSDYDILAIRIHDVPADVSDNSPDGPPEFSDGAFPLCQPTSEGAPFVCGTYSANSRAEVNALTGWGLSRGVDSEDASEDAPEPDPFDEQYDSIDEDYRDNFPQGENPVTEPSSPTACATDLVQSLLSLPMVVQNDIAALITRGESLVPYCTGLVTAALAGEGIVETRNRRVWDAALGFIIGDHLSFESPSRISINLLCGHRVTIVHSDCDRIRLIEDASYIVPPAGERRDIREWTNRYQEYYSGN